MQNHLLYLENLSMYYHSGSTVAVGLDKISLAFDRGEFVAITGESGSGKTSLLSVISSILPFHDGELYYNGTPASYFGDDEREAYRREHIGFIFQNYNLINSYTAAQNIEVTLAAAGYSRGESKKRISKLLSQVGLSGLEHRRASKLSAGQKQRLAIARALAKDTDIIVADEPTGNLDTENGQAIVKLLASLSHDRLIIMVTHNYEEAAPYVTRKIKLHDGRVTVDEPVIHAQADDDARGTVNTVEIAAVPRRSDKKTALRLAAMSLSARPARMIFTLVFLIFVAVASFIFLGAALSYSDDTSTRIYDNSAFRNGDPLRLVIMHHDGTEINDADLAAIKGVEHVVMTEKFDSVADCNYYYKPDIDYSYKYHIKTETEFYDSNYRTVVFNDINRYMRTSSCISEDDLAAGRMPEAINEIVMYGAEPGDTVDVFIRDIKNWGVSSFLNISMTVTGVLAEPTEQIYFSPEMGENIHRNSGVEQIEFTYTYSANDFYQGQLIIRIKDRVIKHIILSVDPELRGYDVKTAAEFHETVGMILSRGKLYREYTEIIDGEPCGKFNSLDEVRPLFAGLYETALEGEPVYPGYKDADAGDMSEKYDTDLVNLSSKNVVTMSREAYRELMEIGTGEVTMPQSTIYIDDYAYIDMVIKTLSDAGYRVTSPYRSGSIKYDYDLLQERLISLFVSLGALIMIFVIGVLVLGLYLKTGAYDSKVLYTLGVRLSVIKRMQAYEVTLYCALSLIISVFVVCVLNCTHTAGINSIIKYYRAGHYAFIAAYNVILGVILTLRLNAAVKRELKSGGGN